MINSLKKITLDIFLEQVSESERLELYNALDKSIIKALSEGISVFLDNFGIVYPGYKKQTYANKEVTAIKAYFEKATILNSFYQETFGRVIDSNELANLILMNLPNNYRKNWNLNTIKKLIKPLVQNLKSQIILNGFSNLLLETGIFISMHNRQGSEFKDWFAGADIFINSTFNQIVKIGDAPIKKEIIFESATEPFDAFYKRISSYELDLTSELKNLGFDISAHHKNFNVNIYQEDNELIFVTDGIRNLSLKSNFGSEFCIILEKNTPKEVANVILTMGWILLSSHKDKILDFGKGLSFGAKIIPNSEIEAIFTAPFKKLKGIKKCLDQNIEFVTLIGISQYEYQLASKRGSSHLLAMLQYRGIDQITKIRNYSLISETILN